jgi:hypothetical protein
MIVSSRIVCAARARDSTARILTAGFVSFASAVTNASRTSGLGGSLASASAARFLTDGFLSVVSVFASTSTISGVAVRLVATCCDTRSSARRRSPSFSLGEATSETTRLASSGSSALPTMRCFVTASNVTS